MADQPLILLFGGQSREHEVSLSSAASVLRRLASAEFTIFPIGVTRAGDCLLYSGSPAHIRDGSWERDAGNLVPLTPTVGGFLRRDTGERLPPAVVFPCLHGETCEDGCVQGMLDFFGIPYIGSGVEASAICFNKVLTKERLRRHHVPVTDWVDGRVTTDRGAEHLLSRAEARLSYPMFVKPARAGSSIGAARADDRASLLSAISKAAEIDPLVLIEPFCHAREIELSILDGEPPIVAPAAEPIYHASFYDYGAKYHGKGAQLSIPARLTPRTAEALRRLSLCAFRALRCRHLARIDFFLCDTGEILLNEVNTLPGMTEASVYPHAMAAAGIPFPRLMQAFIRLADKSRL